MLVFLKDLLILTSERWKRAMAAALYTNVSFDLRYFTKGLTTSRAPNSFLLFPQMQHLKCCPFTTRNIV